jgi:hypothetical protein
MTKQQCNAWMMKFGKAWCERNVEQVMSLFDKKHITYYESVFTPPVTSFERIKELWKVVPTNQKDVVFEHKIISCSRKQGIVNWKLSRIFIPTKEKQLIDGIFQISLNKKGLCTFFKQWRMVKTEL